MPVTLTLPDLLLRAGAVIIPREGCSIPAHYGSAAAELAVCTGGVGLAARPDLAVLELSAPADALDRLSSRVVNSTLAAGGVAQVGGVWWCRSPDSDEIHLICRRQTAPRAVRALRGEVNRLSRATLTDRSETHVLLNVVGPCMRAVLRAVGIRGSQGGTRAVPPFIRARLDGSEVRLLTQTQTDVLIISDRADSTRVWQTLMEAGRAAGICCVGIEAVDRFRVRERVTSRSIDLL